MHAKLSAISVASATTCGSHGLQSVEDRLLVWPRDFRPEADRILAGGVSHRYQYATDTARRAVAVFRKASGGLRHRQRLFRPPGWIYYFALTLTPGPI